MTLTSVVLLQTVAFAVRLFHVRLLLCPSPRLVSKHTQSIWSIYWTVGSLDSARVLRRRCGFKTEIESE